jgi:hypothetical protein
MNRPLFEFDDTEGHPTRAWHLPAGGPVNGDQGLGIRPVASYYLDMRIVVVGEGSWKCDELATSIVRRLVTSYGQEIVIVHRDPTGVVESFEVACKRLGIRTETRVPSWRTGAPPLRLRADELFNGGVDLCIAVHRYIGICNRTIDCVRRAV